MWFPLSKYLNTAQSYKHLGSGSEWGSFPACRPTKMSWFFSPCNQCTESGSQWEWSQWTSSRALPSHPHMIWLDKDIAISGRSMAYNSEVFSVTPLVPVSRQGPVPRWLFLAHDAAHNPEDFGSGTPEEGLAPLSLEIFCQQPLYMVSAPLCQLCHQPPPHRVRKGRRPLDHGCYYLTIIQLTAMCALVAQGAHLRAYRTHWSRQPGEEDALHRNDEALLQAPVAVKHGDLHRTVSQDLELPLDADFPAMLSPHHPTHQFWINLGGR